MHIEARNRRMSTESYIAKKCRKLVLETGIRLGKHQSFSKKLYRLSSKFQIFKKKKVFDTETSLKGEFNIDKVNQLIHHLPTSSDNFISLRCSNYFATIFFR